MSVVASLLLLAAALSSDGGADAGAPPACPYVERSDLNPGAGPVDESQRAKRPYTWRCGPI